MASSDARAWNGALLRRWSGTSPVMIQPPLDHHYVVMHLGGAKRIQRKHDGPTVSTIAEYGSLTLVPAGTAFTWRTTGPIAFAHLYLRPDQLCDVVSREFEREGRGACLVEKIACRDRWLEPLLERMLAEIERAADASTMRLDCLLESFLIRLARNHLSHVGAKSRRTVALAPHRLQRVLDFIETNLGRDVALADLIAAAGTSQFHFSHAFRTATGSSPYRYLIRRRIEYAKVLLMTSDDSLAAVSAKCGFNSSHQFAVMFKREVGVGPKRYGMSH